MKMISSKCLPSRAMHCCSRYVKLRIAEICNITPNGYSLTMKRSLMVLSRICFGPVWKILRSPINGNGLRHYRVDGQVQHLPASSRKQPAIHASHVLEIPGPSLFCMGGISSPDVKFSAPYDQIPFKASACLAAERCGDVMTAYLSVVMVSGVCML